VIAGGAFTVTVKVCDIPAHPFADGVTVITPVIDAVLLLVAVKEDIFPVPDAPRPMAVLELTQV